MKVFDLACDDGHHFEGWFGSSEQFDEQCAALAVRCPLCESSAIRREPSAPRLNFGAGNHQAEVTTSPAAGRQKSVSAGLMDSLRQLIAQTENVGPRFAEEARRIHYDEAPARPIRGIASERERRDLHDEGIDTLNIPIPRALTETMQ